MIDVTPETRYARSGDVHIAYQVVGTGSVDLVYMPGFMSHVECAWDEPLLARFLERLAGFSRLIMLDKRGTGLSDAVTGMPTLEQRVDDVRAVMDASGSERAALLGISEGGTMAMMFAATHPERTSHLTLYGAIADFRFWCPTPESLEETFHYMRTAWGTGGGVAKWAPSLMNDERFTRAWARWERQGASPGAAIALMRMNSEIDIRHVLPTVRVPTLVIHRAGDTAIEVAAGRQLAQHIPEARYVELPGVDHLPWVGDADSVVDAIEEFVTGTRGARDVDRVLATVLFTDIVGSTQQLARMGDRRWRELLDVHHDIVRQELARFRGRLIDTAGDGLFASFDGPARAIRCAYAIRDAVRALGIETRTGLHTGECEVMGDKVGGLAVHIGARVMATAAAGEVLVSNTVKDLVAGAGIDFEPRGQHQLKGVPGEWTLYAVRAIGGARS